MKLVANEEIKYIIGIIINLTLFQYTVTSTTLTLVSLGLGYSCTTLKLVTAAGTIDRHKMYRYYYYAHNTYHQLYIFSFLEDSYTYHQYQQLLH